MTKRAEATAIAEPLVLNELPDDASSEYDVNYENMSQHERPARDEAKATKFPVQYADTTYFWHVEGDHESEIARVYVDVEYPGSEAFVVSEIPIQMLTQQHSVIILSRPRRNKFPLIRIMRDAQGHQVHDLVDPHTMLKSVRESPIIAIKPFVKDASRYSIGKFDANKFFDRAAEEMFGGHIHIQAKENTVRFVGG